MSDQVGNPEDRFSHNEAHILLLQTVYGGDRDINLLVKHVVNNQILAAEYTKTEGQVEIDAPYHGTMSIGTGITLTSF